MKMLITILFLLFSIMLKAQIVYLSNIVINEKNEILKDVSVIELKKNIGSFTNNEGICQLILNKGEINIKFLLKGFNEINKKLILTNDTIIIIKLESVIKNENKKLDKQCNEK